MPNGDKIIMKPEDVVWIRRPHPLDPYLSMTPMESAGIAIEIENLAKLYNRNFLLNDGRPGGLLVLRGEIDEDDKEELRSRFRGNMSRFGTTTVVSADDGVDYVDTSSNPRDAAYIQMRQITKEEILASFGVPESVIGNAAGRTFNNASEEVSVFWNETMSPHLEVLARALARLAIVSSFATIWYSRPVIRQRFKFLYFPFTIFRVFDWMVTSCADFDHACHHDGSLFEWINSDANSRPSCVAAGQGSPFSFVCANRNLPSNLILVRPF